MFQNRHGGSHATGKFKEYMDRAIEEHNGLQNQVNQLRMELEKARNENESMMRQQSAQAEAFFTAQMELQRNVEIVKRLTTAINQFIPNLPQEHQGNAINMTERARNVTPQDLMMQQQQMSMYPFNGMGNPGMHPMMAAMAQMKPEDLAAMMSGQKMPPGMMMPHHPNMAMLAAAASAAGQMPPGAGNLSSGGMGINEVADRLRDNRPRSGSGHPPKRAKTEPQDHEDLEIDVQNDDPPMSANTHTNGNLSHKKDGRDSAMSVSSRDSATPKSRTQIPGNLNNMNVEMMQTLMQQMSSGALDPSMILGGSNKTAAYSYFYKDGVADQQPAVFPDDAMTDPDVPKKAEKLFDLNQGEVVCAVTFAPTNDKLYTGGKGYVKLWDITSRETAAQPVKSFKCFNDNYIRSCKLFPEENWLLIGGEAKNIIIYDVANESIVTEFITEAPACYALAIAQDSKLCFSCCANGEVTLWDIRQREKVATLSGHADGVSCIDISPDGNTLWTGGLDSTVRSWDIGERRQIEKHDLDSQAFSLGCCPTQPWVAVGTENHLIEVINTECKEKYIVHSHESNVLSLKFAKSGKFFVSTGKDHLVNVFRTPYGARLFRLQETSSVLSCDISNDEKYLVTGSGLKKATVYELIKNGQD